MNKANGQSYSTTVLTMVILCFVSSLLENSQASPIPRDFDKNTVQFIFTKVSDTNYVPLGTCFGVQVTSVHKPIFWHRFVRIATAILPLRIGAPDIMFRQRYFVTAKHVLYDEHGDLRPKMYMRLAHETGGVTYLYLNPDLTNGNFHILIPQDKSVDLAVIALDRPISQQELKAAATNNIPKPKLGCFDASIIADNHKLQKYNIKEGCEMFFLGLFTPFYGANENIPICRFGHLAMLPTEPVRIGNDYQHLYLMETEAWGGNSGSPAFFSFSSRIGSRIASNGRELNPFFSKRDRNSMLFAGVVVAYFKDYTPIMMANSTYAPNVLAVQNSGITAVVPASYLYEILFSQEEKQFRDKVFQAQFPTGYK
jgi:hypothetical protein